MEEEGGRDKSAKPSAKLSDTCGGSVERHWWDVPLAVHPEAFIVRNALRRLCQLFLVDRAKAAVDCLFALADSSATSVRLIIDQFVSLSLFILFIFFSPLFSPLFLPSPLLFFISNDTKNRFCKKREREKEREEGGGEKKTRRTKRERTESFRFVERIASLFSIGRKCRIEVEFRLKRFHGVESCLADFYISRSPLVALEWRGIDISRVCARFVVVWSVTNANTSVQDPKTRLRKASVPAIH